MKIHSFLMATLTLASLSVAACDSPPEIDRILLDRSILRSDESAVLSITVRDKSGLDDLVGAQLYSQDLTYWYGSLGEVSDGVFETVITWGRLQQAAPITFDFPIQRTLTVIVEDNEGNSDSLPVTLELRCRSKEHACNGACYPVDVDCKDV